MSTVYVLTSEADYEGETVWGVYSSEEKARGAIQEMSLQGDRPVIWPLIVDASPSPQLFS